MSTLSDKLREAIAYITVFLKAESEYTVELMRKNPYRIQELIKPSKDLQIAAIQTDPSVIQFIPNVSEKMQLLAITINPSTIQYIPNPTKDIQLTAVKISPSVIQYIKEPSKDIMLTAIERDSSAIKHISNPSEELQLIAIRKNPEAIQYIKHPTTEVQLEVIHTSQNTTLIEKVEMDMVKVNPGVIAILPNPSEAVQLKAVKEDAFVISKINNPSETVQLTAIQKDIYSIQCIRNPTTKVLFQAIKLSSNDPFYINILPESLQITAVQTNPSIFSLITNPSPKIHKTVIESICNIKINGSVDNDFVPKAQSLLCQLDLIKNKHSEMSLTADYSDDRQQARKEQDKADKWKDTETNKAISTFKEEIKNNYPFLEDKTEDIFSYSKVDTTDKEIIGKVSFYGLNGKLAETIEYNTAESYLKSIKDELNSNPNGFKYETLTTDANIRKSVDDVVYGAYGEDNPHNIEWYEQKLSSPTSSSHNEHIIQSSGCKALIGDVPDSSGNETQIDDFRIMDKSTGKTEPLNIGDIDLNKQSPETIKEFLSGKQVEMTTKSGASQLVGLSKTLTGWGIQAGKQIFNMADSSAEI